MTTGRDQSPGNRARRPAEFDRVSRQYRSPISGPDRSPYLSDPELDQEPDTGFHRDPPTHRSLTSRFRRQIYQQDQGDLFPEDLDLYDQHASQSHESGIEEAWENFPPPVRNQRRSATVSRAEALSPTTDLSVDPPVPVPIYAGQRTGSTIGSRQMVSSRHAPNASSPTHSVFDPHAPADDPLLLEGRTEEQVLADVSAETAFEKPKSLFSLSAAYQAVFDFLPESTDLRPPTPPPQVAKSSGEAAVWRYTQGEQPSLTPALVLPLSQVVKESFQKCDDASRASSDRVWQLPNKVLKRLVQTGAYRPPATDPSSGLDLSAAASLDADAARAHLPRVPPSSQATLPLSLLEKWEVNERQCLGLASQLDFFSAAVAEITAKDPVDIEQLHQVVMFLSRSTGNLAALASSNLAEMLRLRRATVLSQAPKFLLESSRERLLTAPLASPFLFGGLIAEVVAADKDDQIHASVAGRPNTTFRTPKRKAPSAASAMPGPPTKRQAPTRAPPPRGQDRSFRGGGNHRGRGQKFQSSRGRGAFRGAPRPSQSTVAPPSKARP